MGNSTSSTGNVEANLNTKNGNISLEAGQGEGSVCIRQNEMADMLEVLGCSMQIGGMIHGRGFGQIGADLQMLAAAYRREHAARAASGCGPTCHPGGACH